MKKQNVMTILLWILVFAGVAVSGGGEARSAPTDAQSKAIRTLDAITIEGEITVPQVLFITSRDFRRHRDGLDSRYRKNAIEVARPSGLPTRLRVVAQQQQHKEEVR